MPTMAVHDVTPISPPSEPVRGHAVSVNGTGAQRIWALPPVTPAAPVVVMHEAGSYYFEPRDTPWRLERGESGWTATDLVTGIFGYGDDPNESIVDLLHALIEHREVLERQDELSPDLQDQLDYLRQ
jgi:hypothetical protein